jgi:hypothetical protein
MYCSRCEAEIDEDSLFCEACGHKNKKRLTIPNSTGMNALPMDTASIDTLEEGGDIVGDETLSLIANHLGFLGYDITIEREIIQDDDDITICYATHDKKPRIKIWKGWEDRDIYILRVCVSLSGYNRDNIGIEINKINKKTILSKVVYFEDVEGAEYDTVFLCVGVKYIGPYVKKNFTNIYDLLEEDIQIMENNLEFIFK